MNRNRMLIGLTVAILVGLGAAGYVYRRIESLATTTGQVPTAQIVVAADHVPVGQRLQRSDLREISWPATQLPDGACRQIDDCIDRAVITSVVENEPILEGNLAPKNGGAGLSVTIPDGMRAISVRVDDVVSVAGFVVPGSMVDVLATGKVGTDDSESVTRTVLQDLKVLAVGQTVEQDPDGKPQTYTVVTLLVTPDQANAVAMMTTGGMIHLSMRNTVDTQTVSAAPVARASLLTGSDAPVGTPQVHHVAAHAAPKPGSNVYVIEVIRGEKRENDSFPDQQNR
jgi:pilus assembly protein CpaB